ncbi:solute carrier family 23 protein [Coprothermobacter platensis]|uniref:solute carrier family 23 protein n=1 Tax=Coprothermobacter platensis TaxID=108819 RepID=UPI000364BE0D|nr:solute carrier family 23 protein [Coprothermobacter platensis]
MLNMEKGGSITQSAKDFGKSITPAGVGVAIAATLFGEGPVFLLLKLLNDAHLASNIAVSWLTIIFIVAGVFSIFASLYYRMPIQFGFSIPAVAIIGSALIRYPFSDILGAVLISGVIVFLLGVTGLFKWVLKYVPIPVIQGMIAGALVTYGIAVVKAIVADPIVAGGTFLIFIVFSLIPVISKRFPPILSALILGFVLALVAGKVNLSTITFSFSSLTFVTPTFSLDAILELTIPLAILTVGFGNIQAIGILKTQGYNPPVNSFVVLSGIGTIINSFFGGHNAVVGGPTIAMMAGPEIGEKDQRYSAAVLAGILMIIVAILSPIVLSFTRSVPSTLIDVVAGVAMLSVIANNFTQAFSSPLKMGALFALMTTLSGITLFHIGATLWAIIFGTIISLLLERNAYLEIVKNTKY